MARHKRHDDEAPPEGRSELSIRLRGKELWLFVVIAAALLGGEESLRLMLELASAIREVVASLGAVK